MIKKFEKKMGTKVGLEKMGVKKVRVIKSIQKVEKKVGVKKSS